MAECVHALEALCQLARQCRTDPIGATLTCGVAICLALGLVSVALALSLTTNGWIIFWWVLAALFFVGFIVSVGLSIVRCCFRDRVPDRFGFTAAYTPVNTINTDAAFQRHAAEYATPGEGDYTLGGDGDNDSLKKDDNVDLSERSSLVDKQVLWRAHDFSYVHQGGAPRVFALNGPSSLLRALYNAVFAYFIPKESTYTQRKGALFCLYCLHGTQLCRPQVAIPVDMHRFKELMNFVGSVLIGHDADDIQDVKEIWRRLLDNNAFCFTTNVMPLSPNGTPLPYNRYRWDAEEGNAMPPRSFCPRLYTPLCVDTLTPAVDCTAVQEHSSVYARAKEELHSLSRAVDPPPSLSMASPAMGRELKERLTYATASHYVASQTLARESS